MAASMPSRTRKKPSAVRSPLTNSRSYSSMSLVSSAADSASVRATSTVGTSRTSAASRAAFSVRTNCDRRHEHLAAEVAALLLGCELVLVVHACGAGLDHLPHQLVGVERPAEARLGVGEDRREPVGAVPALRPVDLVGPHQRAVEALDERGSAVRRIEALVGIRAAGEVRVGGDLPPREVDRLEAGLDHLHGLAAGHRAERAHRLLAAEQLPQPLGAEPGDRLLGDDRCRAAGRPPPPRTSARSPASARPAASASRAPPSRSGSDLPVPSSTPRSRITVFRILNGTDDGAQRRKTPKWDPKRTITGNQR